MYINTAYTIALPLFLSAATGVAVPFQVNRIEYRQEPGKAPYTNGTALPKAPRPSAGVERPPDSNETTSANPEEPSAPPQPNNDAAQAACENGMNEDEWERGKYNSVLRNMLRAGPAVGDLMAGNLDLTKLGLTQDVDPNFDHGLIWKKADRSVIDVVRSWATRVDKFVCRSLNDLDAKCSSLDLGSKENCATSIDPEEGINTPQAVNLLKTISNFAQSMSSATGTLMDARESIKSKGREIHQNFNWNPEDDSKSANGPLGNSAGYIIASAIAGTIPSVGGFLAAPLGILIGANNPAVTEAYEPKFERQNEFEVFVDDLANNMRELIKQGTERVLNVAPNLENEEEIKKWISGPGSLSTVLSDGRYAVPESQTLAQEGIDSLGKIIYSAAIDREWKASNVMVVRVMPDQFALMGLKGDGICEKEPQEGVPLWTGHKYCDPEGAMYFAIRYNWNADKTKVPGQEKLDDYGLDIRDALRNSETWGHKHGFSDAADKWKETAAEQFNSGLDVETNPTVFQHWTLPVCDIAQVPLANPILTSHEACKDDADPALCSLLLNTMCRCAKIKDWPYGEAPYPEEPFITPFSHEGEWPDYVKKANAWKDACREARGDDSEVGGGEEGADEP